MQKIKVYLAVLDLCVCTTITYVWAVADGTADPIPHTTITNSATNYPSYIIFRMGIIILVPALVFIMMCIYGQISCIKQEILKANSHANLSKHCSWLLIVFTIILAISFPIVIATIDPYEMNEKVNIFLSSLSLKLHIKLLLQLTSCTRIWQFLCLLLYIFVSFYMQ